MNIFVAEINGHKAILNPEESWHCCKVLRHQAGTEIGIIDGKGNHYRGVLTVVHEKNCEADVTSGPTPEKKRNYRLHLAICPTKNLDRIEWLVEKAVEIGVDEISFIKAFQSERKSIKIERIHKIVLSAIKQSQQASLPLLNEMCSFKEFVQAQRSGLKCLAHCENTNKIEFKDIDFNEGEITVMIGPEGDFTSEEINMAESSDYKMVSLGETRLRTETAGLYAVMAMQFLTKV